jgi:hypothetical protein
VEKEGKKDFEEKNSTAKMKKTKKESLVVGVVLVELQESKTVVLVGEEEIGSSGVLLHSTTFLFISCDDFDFDIFFCY